VNIINSVEAKPKGSELPVSEPTIGHHPESFQRMHRIPSPL